MGTGFVGGAIGNTVVGYFVKKYKKTWFVGASFVPSVPSTVLTPSPCVSMAFFCGILPPSLEASVPFLLSPCKYARAGGRRSRQSMRGMRQV